MYSRLSKRDPHGGAENKRTAATAIRAYLNLTTPPPLSSSKTTLSGSTTPRDTLATVQRTLSRVVVGEVRSSKTMGRCSERLPNRFAIVPLFLGSLSLGAPGAQKLRSKRARRGGMRAQKRSHHATLLSVDCQSVRAGGCGGAEAQRLGWCRRGVFEQQNEGILFLLQLQVLLYLVLVLTIEITLYTA